jgi:hypothetical protein
VDRACSKYGRGVKYIQIFGWKVWSEDTTWKPVTYVSTFAEISVASGCACAWDL